MYPPQPCEGLDRIEARLESLEEQLINMPAAIGVDGKDGQDGRDGEDADPTQVAASLVQNQQFIAAIASRVRIEAATPEEVARQVVERLPPIYIPQADDQGNPLPDLEIRPGDMLPPIQFIQQPMKRNSAGEWIPASEQKVDYVHLGEGYRMRLHPLVAGAE
jgi:hypothetical protein